MRASFIIVFTVNGCFCAKSAGPHSRARKILRMITYSLAVRQPIESQANRFKRILKQTCQGNHPMSRGEPYATVCAVRFIGRLRRNDSDSGAESTPLANQTREEGR